MENKPKNAIFLSGGGAIGSFQIGFFQAMVDYGVPYDSVFGCSAGAIVGGAATYLKPNEIYERWQNLTYESVLNLDSNKIKEYEEKKIFLGKILDPDSKLVKNVEIRRNNLNLIRECAKSVLRRDPHFLIDVNKIKLLLKENLDGEEIKKSSIDFGISTTVLPYKMKIIWKKDMVEDPLDYILASSYMPVFSREGIIDGRQYLDICRFRKYPLDIFDNEEFDNIFIVNVEAENMNKILKPIDKYYSDGRVKVLCYNNLISVIVNPLDQFTGDLKGNRKVIFINYDNKPSIFNFSKEQTKKNYDAGYDTTEKVLKLIK